MQPGKGKGITVRMMLPKWSSTPCPLTGILVAIVPALLAIPSILLHFGALSARIAELVEVIEAGLANAFVGIVPECITFTYSQH
jgi:hypothetical protein